jgi:hypothetical protein
VKKGVLYGPILHILLRDTGREETLTRLMVKIGLIVKFVSESVGEEMTYLVPALLPRAGQPSPSSLILTAPVNTCFLVFTISSLIVKQEYVCGLALCTDCHKRFDAYLVAIDPTDNKLVVSESLMVESCPTNKKWRIK